jgi:hypothetical protein
MDCALMSSPDDVAAAIHGTRVTDMRAWIMPRLPGMALGELYAAWIDAIEGVASFVGDAPWLDLVEAEYVRRHIEPGTPAPRPEPSAND